MDNSIYLFAAYSITWGIIFLYVFYLFKRQNALGRQIDKIEKALRREGDLKGGHL